MSETLLLPPDAAGLEFDPLLPGAAVLSAHEQFVLPPAPPHLLGSDGMPRFGRFAGDLARLDWRGVHTSLLPGPLLRPLRHKRWRYLALCTDEVFCGIALVHLGWVSSAFAYVFEWDSAREIFAISREGLPLAARLSGAPFAGADCLFSAGGTQIRFAHQAGSQRYRLQVNTAQLQIDAELDATDAAPALLAVGTVQHGANTRRAHATQKSAAWAMRGELRLGARKIVLDGGVASLDYSCGSLARETSWRWASAHARGIGFNLQQGYFGAQENALWLDGALYPLGPAHFVFDPAQPGAPWRISTEDGLLELEFIPAGVRAQNKNLGLAASRYFQPVGHFNGWVKPWPGAPAVAVRQLPGVTEDHFSRW
ncbi:DUF2804 domain-containing protein [Massilia sp. W12]|uniref:DUF2804 domain-containing protein n=1 Tax=Massilia sp. W12 TaxID=3126507 RepID=UPI0030CAAFFD